MRRLRELYRPTLLETFGIAALTVGVAFIYWPAALIVGGVAVVFLAQGMNRS